MRGNVIGATRRFFEQEFEEMSRDAIRDVQWRAFQALLRRAADASPFYRRKFAAVGLDPDDVRHPDDVVKVPLTTKDEVLRDIEEHPPYGSRLQVDRRAVV